ncbi:hypothetical protein QYF61_003411 [Mycteria americana]|uniref:Uncharacterized protein n=1 Tax=Mycteria americana TaxID=33587 RepID=A0AAN7SCE0_MYCAM|nr:hypothetical protein QYF61_003411 [Mycteria americana]
MVVNGSKPFPSLLHAKQPQFPQLLLIRLLLQTLHQLRCPSLDTLQHLNVPLVVGGPKLNTVFEVRPHQCRVQGDNHFPSPAGHKISDTSQDAIGLLGHLGTLLAHIQPAVDQYSQVLFCQAAFQPLFPKPVALHGVVVTQVQDLALSLVEPHTIGLGPSIQSVQIPLKINTPTQLGVVCKLTEGTLDPLIQIIDKDIKKKWPQYSALGNTTCDRPPTGFNSIHHNSLGLAIQPVFHPVKSTPVQAMSSQFLQENADCLPGDSVNQSSNRFKLCPPELQGSSSADPLLSSPRIKKSFCDHYAQEITRSERHTITFRIIGLHIVYTVELGSMKYNSCSHLEDNQIENISDEIMYDSSLQTHLAIPGLHLTLLTLTTTGPALLSLLDMGWRLNHFPGQPVPMLHNPLGEEIFPNIQSKPPLAQLEAISSCPITCYLGEETDPHLSTTSFQAVVESKKVSPQPPFLQAKQPQLPQPLLIRLLLQTLHQLRCPSLHTLQHLNVSLVVGGPKLNTVFEVRPHQCRVQGHNHFPSPAGHAIFDTSQDAIGFLGHLGTLLAHIQAAVNQHPQVLLCQAAFQPLFPKPVALHGVVVAQVKPLALGLVKPHTIDLSPSIQPVQVPLQSLPTLQQINTPTQLAVICKLAESALDPFVQIIDKDIKQNWPQHRALGNTACDRLPIGVNSIHHHSLGPAVQPVLYPVKSTPVQAMSSQFLQENAVGNRVKGFTEV